MIPPTPGVTCRSTRRRTVLILAIAAALLAINLFPHRGPPNFRYTGSDRQSLVWNFGWPLATCVYDPLFGIVVSDLALIQVAIQAAAIAKLVIGHALLKRLWPKASKSSRYGQSCRADASLDGMSCHAFDGHSR